jgi:hypothetical protein
LQLYNCRTHRADWFKPGTNPETETLAEKSPFRTEQLRLETGERFALIVAADGMPVWWPNLYCQIRIRERGISFSAMHAYMSAICIFHGVCDGLGIDVDARIESLELFREEEIAALREELRRNLRNSNSHGSGSNDEPKAVKNAHWKSRLTAVCNYIVITPVRPTRRT